MLFVKGRKDETRLNRNLSCPAINWFKKQAHAHLNTPFCFSCKHRRIWNFPSDFNVHAKRRCCNALQATRVNSVIGVKHPSVLSACSSATKTCVPYPWFWPLPVFFTCSSNPEWHSIRAGPMMLLILKIMHCWEIRGNVGTFQLVKSQKGGCFHWLRSRPRGPDEQVSCSYILTLRTNSATAHQAGHIDIGF